MAHRYDIEVIKGETWQLTVRWRLENGVIVPVEQYDWKMVIKENYNDADVDAIGTFLSTGVSPNITLDSGTGTIGIAFTQAQTWAMDFDLAYYDLMCRKGSTGNVKKLIYGYASLQQSVTNLSGSEVTVYSFTESNLTAGEDLDAVDAVYYDASLEVKKAKANSMTTARVQGFALDDYPDDDTSVQVRHGGEVSNSSWAWTAPFGRRVFLSAATGGAIVQDPDMSVGNVLVPVGWTRNATKITIEIGEAVQL